MRVEPIRAVFSKQETCDFLGIGLMTLHRLVESGDFPPKIQLSPRRVGFRRDDVERWLELKTEKNAV